VIQRYLSGLVSPAGLIGLTLVGIVFLCALVGPVVYQVDPNFQARDADLLSPSWAHPMGTDQFGRDLLSRVLHGIRVDMRVGLVGVPVAAFVGVLTGIFATLWPKLDVGVQRTFDVMFAFPPILVGIAAAALVSSGELSIVTAVIFSGLPIYGRIARAGIMLQRSREYVEAARVVGASRSRILLRHILPNTSDPIVVQVALSLAQAIFLEGGLSFVGLGVQPPQPSLGGLIRSGASFLSAHPTYALSAMIPLSALVLGLNLIADALNSALLRR
jgi:peptide/nickel transport system permease protein